MKSHLLALIFGGLGSFIYGSTFSPARPPAIPLAGMQIPEFYRKV